MSDQVTSHDSLEEAEEAFKEEEAKRRAHSKAAKAEAPKGKVKVKKASAKGKGKELSPAEFAEELGMTPKALRVILRRRYGTHHERWVISPTQQKEVREGLRKAAKEAEKATSKK